jgi:hypothetical protein
MRDAFDALLHAVVSDDPQAARFRGSKSVGTIIAPRPATCRSFRVPERRAAEVQQAGRNEPARMTGPGQGGGPHRLRYCGASSAPASIRISLAIRKPVNGPTVAAMVAAMAAAVVAAVSALRWEINERAMAAPPSGHTAVSALIRANRNRPAANSAKRESAHIGEQIAAAYIKSRGIAKNVESLGLGGGQYAPGNVITRRAVFDVKTDQVSNAEKSQHWRSTIGQTNPAKRAHIASLSKEEKQQYHAVKQAAIMLRKRAALEKLKKERGRDFFPQTIGVILNPDKQTADIHHFYGLHQHSGWNSQ